jgi:hypothetical protein
MENKRKNLSQRKFALVSNVGFALRMISLGRAVVMGQKLMRRGDHTLLYSHVEDLFREGYLESDDRERGDLQLTPKGWKAVRRKLSRPAAWAALKKAPYGRFFRAAGGVFVARDDPGVHITRDAMELLVEAGKMECIPSLQMWTRRPGTV